MGISQFDADASGTAIPQPWPAPAPRPTPFGIQFSWTSGVMTVAVSGEIDLATTPMLTRAFERVPAYAGGLVVDLSKVTFLDASGLATLIRCKGILAEHAVSMAVVAPPDCRAVRMVFDITRLTGPLGVVGSLDEALAEGVARVR